MKNNLLAWGVALAAGAPLLVLAQAASTASPQQSPQLSYRSAFNDYKPYEDAPPGNWRELNATVAGSPRGASGHASHSMGGMTGMEMPAAPASAASAPMRMKPGSMHDGHPAAGGKK
jgi:hypothetical protein